jgi:hypothetical protein
VVEPSAHEFPIKHGTPREEDGKQQADSKDNKVYMWC